MNPIIPRATVEEIVGYRNRALELYAEAFDAIAIADEKIKAAHETARRAHPGLNGYNAGHSDEITQFYNAVNLPDRDHYLRVARRITDINIWAWIIERTDLERLMDKEAKDKLRDQMRYVPERGKNGRQLITEEEADRGLPPVTVENIQATLEKFMTDADTIFRRGIANAFSKLDRRFRSHDGFKIGSRVILDRVFDEHGHWNFYGNERDTLVDVERTFAVLDNKPPGTNYAGILHTIDMARGRGWGARQTELDTDYYRLRVFKNGNVHLWFQRPDLVEKVNKLLAEHYGEVIPDGQQTEEDLFANKKMTPARNFGFFPTPDAVADTIIENASLYTREGRLTVLEPSAGTGNLARRCIDKGAIVDCVEIQPELSLALQQSGSYRRVFPLDFLSLRPSVTGLYDRVVMNPPFDRERDIDHVTHAFDFLKPDGLLIAVMSAGTEFRETRKSVAFRQLVEKMCGKFRDLPAGSFAEVGTYINTVYVRIWKDGKQVSW